MKRLSGWRSVGALALVTLLVWLGLRGLPDGRLHVCFLDVGQGDAIFVRTPQGQQLLVDGGPSPTALLAELGDVMPYWDRTIDLVVLTHPDADHLNGLLAVLERYRVSAVLATAATYASPAAAAWQAQLAASPGTQQLTAAAGMQLQAGEAGLTVVHAPAAEQGRREIENDDSLVVRLDYGEVGVLLTGDAEGDAEREMMAAGAQLAATVLKVGHHGSNASTSSAFLAAVHPQLAVIQAGAGNPFGLPHPATLTRLEGVKVLRTDSDGRIELITDGQRLWTATSTSTSTSPSALTAAGREG